jgi:hypothetical protein
VKWFKEVVVAVGGKKAVVIRLDGAISILYGEDQTVISMEDSSILQAIKLDI